MRRTNITPNVVVSALRARSHFGKLLRRIEEDHQSLIIEKRGTPRAVLLSLRDYVRLAAPEPEILRLIGEHFARKGANKLSGRQIDRIIADTRAGRNVRAGRNTKMSKSRASDRPRTARNSGE